ncbi:hypothetical protein ILYODFUR_017437, partial [Ilyodon furcidens]
MRHSGEETHTWVFINSPHWPETQQIELTRIGRLAKDDDDRFLELVVETTPRSLSPNPDEATGHQ